MLINIYKINILVYSLREKKVYILFFFLIILIWNNFKEKVKICDIILKFSFGKYFYIL